jgi:predicted dehydrogenase
MSSKVRWGVLSTARIGLRKVIPGMQKSRICSIDAIASRDLLRAEAAAKGLGIAKAYGSYVELLADPGIDAIYNPLPNQLHVPWTIKAAEAGKHVLCEKPIAMNADEARTLLAVRDRTHVKIGEAFMIRTHLQWLRVHELLSEGRIGELQSIAGFFSYYNVDPKNIRNQMVSGGGALLDIGCYLVHASRHVFGGMPRRVVGLIDRDPEMKIDRLTSAILDFEHGQSIFTCSTQMAPYQRVQFLGDRGRIEVEIPFNAPPDKEMRILIDTGSDLTGGSIVVETVAACDQYTLQGDAFAKAIAGNDDVPVPIEDAIDNMAVMDAIFTSAETGRWEAPVRRQSEHSLKTTSRD